MKITTSIVLFYVWLTASANLLIEVGFADALGVSLDTTAGGEFQQGIQRFGSIEASGLSADSLLGVFIVIANSLDGFIAALTAAPRLLLNLGIPSVFVVFIHAPLALLGTRLLIFVLSGREL
jgi:hypothetical protein